MKTHEENLNIDVHSQGSMTRGDEYLQGLDAEKSLGQIIKRNFAVLFLSAAFLIITTFMIADLWAKGYFSNQPVSQKTISVKIIDMYQSSGNYMLVENLQDKKTFEVFLGWHCKVDTTFLNTNQKIIVKTFYRPYNQSSFQDFTGVDKFCKTSKNP